MSWKTRAGISLFATIAVLELAVADRVWQGSAVIIQVWWILPLSASFVSLVALALQSAMANSYEKGASSLRTPAYLISGPSLASLSLVPLFSLGPSPPAWVGSIMFVFLCVSAWVYYQTLKRSDDDN
ncbi:MAG TPA: hypothetical protein VGR56_03465 [Nitrososphaerales archaeon]|nr:hypothetical protein [Nitrososphaerales archaeon]